MIGSFKRELDRQNTIRWISQHTYGKPHISWDSKLKYKKLAEELGIKTARIYQQSKDLSGLVEPSQDKWVLKPCRGSANRGVFPVVNRNGKLYSYFADKYMTWAQIKKACGSSDNIKGPYIVEQFIGGELQDNWEFYAFDGEIGLIRQRRQVSGRQVDGRTHKFWTPQWEDAGEIEERTYDHNLPTPLHPDELLETASRLSKSLQLTFARIDLYDTPDGVYYGEVTMHPGPGNNFTEDVDRHLGRMWLNAEARRL